MNVNSLANQLKNTVKNLTFFDKIEIRLSVSKSSMYLSTVYYMDKHIHIQVGGVNIV